MSISIAPVAGAVQELLVSNVGGVFYRQPSSLLSCCRRFNTWAELPVTSIKSGIVLESIESRQAHMAVLHERRDAHDYLSTCLLLEQSGFQRHGEL